MTRCFFIQSLEIPLAASLSLIIFFIGFLLWVDSRVSVFFDLVVCIVVGSFLVGGYWLMCLVASFWATCKAVGAS